MIGNQKQRDNGYIGVSTKVPPQVSELLNILANSRGMEVYELLQLLIHGFISYAKAEQSVPEEFRRLYESLKYDAAWCQAFNFASPTAVNDIAQLILILQQSGKKGFGMTMIDKPWMDQAKMTTCLPGIFERVCELALGQNDYLRLRSLNTSMHSTSTLDTVRMMIDAQEVININNEDREEMQAPGNYTDYGRIYEYGKRTKVKHRKGMDMYDRQQTIRFTDDDRQQADDEVDRCNGDRCGDCQHCDDANPYGKTFCDLTDQQIDPNDKACGNYE